MIRGSIFVAVAAIALSLLLHMLGLSITSSDRTAGPPASASPESVTLGNSFEELAGDTSDPIEPEPTEAPEPPEEPPIEPEQAEIPISEALVASSNPQETFAPDTGSETIVQPAPPLTEPVEPSGDGTASDAVDETPPVQPEIAAEVPKGDPDAGTPVEEAPSPEDPEQLAALPDATAAIVPPLDQATDPEIANQPAEAPGEATPDGDSQQAVTASIRPRLPDRPATQSRPGTPEGLEAFDNLRFPRQEIDSPLTTYRRSGVDAFTQGNAGARSGGRGPGNSDTTNYAGQVLVHLNRTPVVYVASRGFAKVFFEINPDGTLAWVDVVDSSGSPEVDRAAKEQVRRGSPFPRPPDGRSRKLSFFYQIN